MKHPDKAPTDAGPRTAVLEADSGSPASTADGAPSKAVSTAEHVVVTRLSPTLEDATDRYRLVRPTLEI